MYTPATITYEHATHFAFYPSIYDYLFSNRFRIIASARSDTYTHEHMCILAGEKEGTGKDYDFPRLSCLQVSQRMCVAVLYTRNLLALPPLWA